MSSRGARPQRRSSGGETEELDIRDGWFEPDRVPARRTPSRRAPVAGALRLVGLGGGAAALEALLARAEASAEGAHRAVFLAQAAELLHTELDDPDAAFAALELGWRSAPFEPALLAGFTALARRGGDAAAVGRLIAAALPALDDPAQALVLCERLWRADDVEAFGIDRAELALRLARARLGAGDSPGAREALEATLLYLPQHREALVQLARLHAAEGDLPAATRLFTRARAAAPSARARVVLAIELAQVLRDAGEGARALALLAEERPERAEARALLSAQLDLAQETGEWRLVVETLVALAETSWGRARARALVAAGHVLRRQLAAPLAAIARYEEALDVEPTDFDTFLRVLRIHEERGDLASQLQAFRAMLGRLSVAPDEPRVQGLRIGLLRGLGAVAHTQPEGHVAATAALEALARLVPGERPCLETLAELHERAGGARRSWALRHRRALIALGETKAAWAAQLRAIARAARVDGDEPLAFRARDALVALGRADADEARDVEAQRQRLPTPPPPLDARAWAAISHPDLRAPVVATAHPVDADPAVGSRGPLALLATVVGNVLLHERGRPPEAWGLSGFCGDEAASGALDRHVNGVAATLGLPRPMVLLRPRRPGLAELVPLRIGGQTWPALVLGEEALQLRARPAQLSLLGRKIALLRPELLVTWPTLGATANAFPQTVAALAQLLGPPSARGAPRLDREATTRARRIARLLPSAELEASREALAALDLDRDPGCLERYLRGAFLTAGRCALVASGDLTAALRLVVTEPLGALTVTAFEQARDLVEFAVSDAYAAWGPSLKEE